MYHHISITFSFVNLSIRFRLCACLVVLTLLLVSWYLTINSNVSRIAYTGYAIGIRRYIHNNDN